ncbi:MAG: archaeosortase/exosortase family protein [Opitutaceae bacterium]
MKNPGSSFDWRAASVGAGALLAGASLVQSFPALRLELFARSAAELISLFTGAPISRSELGWMIPLSGAPVVVTIACSATDFFLLVATLLGFQVARRGFHPLVATGLAVAAALPVAIFVNAMRIITVAYAHPWLISRLPPKYEAILHMATGAAIFLPALILLNLVLETYGNRHAPSTRV